MICWAQLASSTSGTTKQPSQLPNISSKLYKAKIAQPVKCVFKMQIAHTEIQEKIYLSLLLTIIEIKPVLIACRV